MKVDFNYQFRGLDGEVEHELEPVLDEEGNPKRDSRGDAITKKGKPFTLRTACISVLTRPPIEIDRRTGQPKEIPAEDKLQWADLAHRIWKCDGLLDLTADEIVLLKKFINKRYRSPLTIKQAFEALDPTDQKKSPSPNKSD